jgi:hypothetical protein
VVLFLILPEGGGGGGRSLGRCISLSSDDLNVTTATIFRLRLDLSSSGVPNLGGIPSLAGRISVYPVHLYFLLFSPSET